MANDQTARFGLPLLQPGQAQKEMTHNEALAQIDLTLQAQVVAIGVNAPPAEPAIGACWIVGDAPTGDWTGQAHALAGWTTGGWRFIVPTEGMCVWSVADGVAARWTAGIWTVGDIAARRLVVDGAQVVGARQPAIAGPSGGAVVDAAARDAIAAILAALAAHGLVVSG